MGLSFVDSFIDVFVYSSTLSFAMSLNNYNNFTINTFPFKCLMVRYLSRFVFLK